MGKLSQEALADEENLNDHYYYYIVVSVLPNFLGVLLWTQLMLSEVIGLRERYLDY